MRVFLTGGTGYVGSAVLEALVRGGHHVDALVRNNEGAAAVQNHWPLVYDRDLGELYARIVNTPTACGVYHANDEGDETVNDIVVALGEHAHTQPSIRHVPLPEARKKMGPYADALALDQRVRSPRARALGWAPTLHSVAGNVARLFDEWKRGKAA